VVIIGPGRTSSFQHPASSQLPQGQQPQPPQHPQALAAHMKRTLPNAVEGCLPPGTPSPRAATATDAQQQQGLQNGRPTPTSLCVREGALDSALGSRTTVEVVCISQPPLLIHPFPFMFP
jgi:hypothetical protein